MDKFEEKMRADGLNEAAIAAFRHNYEQLVAGVDGIVPEGSIEAIEVCTRPRLQFCLVYPHTCDCFFLA